MTDFLPSLDDPVAMALSACARFVAEPARQGAIAAVPIADGH